MFLSNVWDTYYNFNKLHKMLVDRYLKESLFQNPRYYDPRKLNKHEYQVFSQNGEDGIIEEIFRRIGVTNRYFVEFGVGNGGGGVENNTLFLLIKGWKGLWMDAVKILTQQAFKECSFLIEEKRLTTIQAVLNAENIEHFFGEVGVPEHFDFLCIDIDGNDYWVWKAITNYHPCVVVIEYNALFPPPVKWIMKYNPQHIQKDTNQYFGASLKSLELLGMEKGYCLVGCDFTGTNAFFVRKELVSDKFLEPFTAENHYEPMRYFLRRKTGERRVFGEFEVK